MHEEPAKPQQSGAEGTEVILPADLGANRAELPPPRQDLPDATEVLHPGANAGGCASYLRVETAPQAALAVGDTFGGFHIEGELGRGQMGIVYRAKRVTLDRTEALKVISPRYADDAAYRARFGREARNAAKLDEPHIVRVYDADERDGRLYIASQFIDGVDLRKKLNSEGSLAPATAAEIATQVGAALDAAHGAGLVHRDVKPANIFVAGTTGAERVYLGDFGVSREFVHSSDVTQTGAVIGTPDYAAPEQHLGKPLDHRVDVYALGCVLFEMLTGRKPYAGDTIAAVAIAHCEAPVPSIRALDRRLPSALDEVVRKAMAKDPRDRFGSTGELAAAALSAVRGGPVRDREPASPRDAVGVVSAPQSCETVPGERTVVLHGPATQRPATTGPATSRRGVDATRGQGGQAAVLTACILLILCAFLPHFIRYDDGAGGAWKSLWQATAPGLDADSPLTSADFWPILGLVVIALGGTAGAILLRRQPLMILVSLIGLIVLADLMTLEVSHQSLRQLVGGQHHTNERWVGAAYWLSIAAAVTIVVGAAASVVAKRAHKTRPPGVA